MRTALLSAIRRSDEGHLRAELMLGGRSVLAWQSGWARKLGCERIICLCETPGGAVLALQRDIEADGAEFHAIRSNIQLAGLVRAEDEMVILLDGLVPDRELTDLWIRSDGQIERSIATLPATHLLAADHPEDFERIDRERRWAGIAVMKAEQLHKLADLPPDSEPVSLLLRLGLQASVPCKELPADSFDKDLTVFAVSERGLARREGALVQSAIPIPAWSAPGRALSALMVRTLAPRWIGSGVEASIAASLVGFLSGLALAFYGYAALGLLFAAIGAFFASMSEAWADLRAQLWSKALAPFWRRNTDIAVNGAILIILIFANALRGGVQQFPELGSILNPAIAVGLSYALAREDNELVASWWKDRTSHCLFFAIAAATGFLPEGIAFFTLLSLASLILSRKRK